MTETQTSAAAALYPEHEKLKSVKDEAQTIGEFLEWLDGQTLTICQHYERGAEIAKFLPAGKPFAQLIADYFGIDRQKLEAEKEAMLDAARAAL